MPRRTAKRPTATYRQVSSGRYLQWRCGHAHHSQPRPISVFCSVSEPVTPVPGIPHELCHLREMRYMKTVRNSWPPRG